jgi:hypothetical protein
VLHNSTTQEAALCYNKKPAAAQKSACIKELRYPGVPGQAGWGKPEAGQKTPVLRRPERGVVLPEGPLVELVPIVRARAARRLDLYIRPLS